MRKKLLLALVLVLAGCSDGGSAPQQAAGFAYFVADQLLVTADDTDPAPINDLDFADAEANEDLFAGLFD